jgi:hypothetical protein
MASGDMFFVVDEETGVPVVTVYGELTIDRLIKFVTAARTIPAFRESDRYLWDLSHVDSFLAPSEVRSFARLTTSASLPPYRSALVVDQEAHFGLSRMFEMLSERPGTKRRVFRDYDKAWEWLTESDSQEGWRQYLAQLVPQHV